MNALAAVAPAALAGSSPYEVRWGSRAQVACANGDVWAGVSCVATDARRGIATYAMRIANNSSQALGARVRDGGSAARDAAFTVAAFSIFETLIPVRVSAQNGSLVEVAGPGVAFSMPIPAAGGSASPQARVTIAVLVAVVSAIVLIAAAISAYALFVRPGRAHAAVSHRSVAIAPARHLARHPIHHGPYAVRVPKAVLMKRDVPHPRVAAARENDRWAPSQLRVTSRARTGEPIVAAWPSGSGEALVSLTDASGSVVSEVDVPAGSDRVTLTAPDVAAASTYDVVVSLSHGFSQEELVRSVTVLP